MMMSDCRKDKNMDLDSVSMENISRIESVLTWIQEFVPQPPDPEEEGSSLQLTFNLKDHLTRLLEREEAGNKREIYGEVERHKTLSAFIGVRLSYISFDIYLGNHTSAMERLNRLRETVAKFSCPELEGMKKAHMRAYNYCADASEYQIRILEWNQLKKKEEEEEEEASPNNNGPNLESMKADIESSRVAIDTLWEKLSKNNQSMATFRFFKGLLAAKLKLEEEKVLDYFIAAIELDPDNFLWYHHAYWRSRHLRKLQRVKYTPRGLIPPGPSRDERAYFKKGFKLAPTSAIMMLDRAILLKEEIWFKDSENWSNTHLCLNAFTELLRAGEKKDAILWNKDILMEKTKVFYAEFLLFGKCAKLNRKEGKDILLKCLVDYPESSDVCHKLGKMYARGVYRTGEYRDNGNAQIYYQEALKLSPSNYPCLMDYLQLLLSFGNHIRMVQTIHTFLKEETDAADAHCVALLANRGLVIWAFDPFKDSNNHHTDACRTWMKALMDFPEQSEIIFNVIKGPPDWVTKRRPLCEAVLMTLKAMKMACGNEKDETDFTAIQIFIDGLTGSSNDDDNHQPKRPSVSGPSLKHINPTRKQKPLTRRGGGRSKAGKPTKTEKHDAWQHKKIDN